MPYCMYFSGGEALHGSTDIQFENISHGCVRIHIDDAKWLRYHFVEGPTMANNFRGTKVTIKSY
jgi:lipoprotein-anchoring transpeptidase ErfK/SrfK